MLRLPPATRMSWITVEDIAFPNGWRNPVEAAQRGRWYCEQLERSQILFFSQPPFDLPGQDAEFLVAQRQADSRIHKNVSYRPQEDVLRGFSDGQETRARMHEVMRRYSTQVTQFVSKFLSPYSGRLALDFASFRPLEEAGRKLPLHKRNDLLHVDAFPSRGMGRHRSRLASAPCRTLALRQFYAALSRLLEGEQRFSGELPQDSPGISAAIYLAGFYR